MLCYNQIMFITFTHTRKECNNSTCYLLGMMLYGINVVSSSSTIGNNVVTVVRVCMVGLLFANAVHTHL